MFPTVEADLLHILNNGTLKQLKGLKEFGQSRADLIQEHRTKGGAPFKAALELVQADLFTAKVMHRIVHANAMDADRLAAQAHAITK